MQQRQPRSVWFFLGLLFLIYGFIIFFEGIYSLLKTPHLASFTEQYHPAIWWGVILFVVGIIFSRIAKFVRHRHLHLAEES